MISIGHAHAACQGEGELSQDLARIVAGPHGGSRAGDPATPAGALEDSTDLSSQLHSECSAWSMKTVILGGARPGRWRWRSVGQPNPSTGGLVDGFRGQFRSIRHAATVAALSLVEGLQIQCPEVS